MQKDIAGCDKITQRCPFCQTDENGYGRPIYCGFDRKGPRVQFENWNGNGYMKFQCDGGGMAFAVAFCPMCGRRVNDEKA